MNRNCLNCGAPIEVEDVKCPYCGTCYVDISTIPTNEPFYLRLNVGTAENPQILVQKVITTGFTLRQEPEYIYANGEPLVIASPNVEYDIHFQGV